MLGASPSRSSACLGAHGPLQSWELNGTCSSTLSTDWLHHLSLCLPSPGSDHTAPPNVTICYRSLALRLEITRHERRRRCPPSFPSGTLLEVHSSVKKDTWFSKRFDALHHRPAFPQNCRLTPLFKNPRLWASGSTEHFLTRGAEAVVWPLTFF